MTNETNQNGMEENPNLTVVKGPFDSVKYFSIENIARSFRWADRGSFKVVCRHFQNFVDLYARTKRDYESIDILCTPKTVNEGSGITEARVTLDRAINSTLKIGLRRFSVEREDFKIIRPEQYSDLLGTIAESHSTGTLYTLSPPIYASWKVPIRLAFEDESSRIIMPIRADREPRLGKRRFNTGSRLQRIWRDSGYI
jgi:hypothetical protein